MTGLELLAMWSQIAGAAIFVILAAVLYQKYMAPAVRTYTEAKNAEIRDCEARRERRRRDLEAARAEVGTGEEDAREIRARVAVLEKREREEAIAAAKAEAERIVRNAEGELERARIAARARLRIEFIEKALLRARQEATSRVDDTVHARLVRSTLEDMTRGRR